MRRLALLAVTIAAACNGSPKQYHDEPLLKVTSPDRGLIQDQAGLLAVSGTVTPNSQGDVIQSVVVNGTAATVAADGTWSASITVPPGATLINTIATDAFGDTAQDTRAVQAGDEKNAGDNIPAAMTVALSTQAFAKIAQAAGPIVQGMDVNAMLAPMQPMQHSGDEDGPDCLYDELFVDNLTFSNVQIGLVPVEGGLSFSAQLSTLDVPGHVNYAVACIDDSTDFEATADVVTVTGTLVVTPDGNGAFATTLANPDVEMTNFHLDASGLPGTILDMIDIDNTIKGIIASTAEKQMGPLMNTALGALGGAQNLNVLGKNVSVQVDPSDVHFTPTGGLITMDTKMLIEGSDAAKFIYTENGTPSYDPGQGFQIGIADDLANEMLAEATSLGMFDLTLAQSAGPVDSVSLSATLPPMISADPTDGTLRLVLCDMIATYLSNGTPIGKAAINATVALQVGHSINGSAAVLTLGTPVISVNVMDDIPNETGLDDADLGTLTGIQLQGQIHTMTALLGLIPIPSIESLSVQNIDIGSDQGYVMMTGTIQ
ncbi:MAG TPA: hypothetical protein VGM88_03575 [Kofleriaceae bacterium]|jgi:hypothetical protein